MNRMDVMLFVRITIDEFLLSAEEDDFLYFKVLSFSDGYEDGLTTNGLWFSGNKESFFIFNQMVMGEKFDDEIYETVILRGSIDDYNSFQVDTSKLFEARWDVGGISIDHAKFIEIKSGIYSTFIIDSSDVYKKSLRGKIFEFMIRMRLFSNDNLWNISISNQAPEYFVLEVDRES